MFAKAPLVRLPRVSRSPQAHALAQQILDEYLEVVNQRIAIKDALKAFTDHLGLPEDAELTACLTALKEMAGRRGKIQIENESLAMPLLLTTGDTAWENLAGAGHYAVTNFQSALVDSFNFRRKEQEKLNTVRTKLQELDKSCYQSQTQEAQDLFATLRCIPEYIEGFMEEINKFLEDVEMAKPCLEDRPSTGLIYVLKHDDNLPL